MIQVLSGLLRVIFIMWESLNFFICTAKKFSEWIGGRKIAFQKHRIPRGTHGNVVGKHRWKWQAPRSMESPLFTRPVIVLKRLAARLFLCHSVTEADSWWGPGTSLSNTKAKWWRFASSHSRSMDYRRLFSKLGELDDEGLKRDKEGFQRLCL